MDRLFNDRRQAPKSRKVYGMWHGGGSYSPPSMADVEEFNSVAHARSVFAERYHGRDPVSGLSTPAVDETAEMHLFHGDPTRAGDPYPDRIIRRGKRGGFRVERT